MYLSNFNTEKLSDKKMKTDLASLGKYRTKVKKVITRSDSKCPEFSLSYPKNEKLHDTLDEVKQKYSKAKHLVLIGIGGSNLGTEAIHSALDNGQVKLHSLDSVSAHNINELLKNLRSVKDVNKLAVCVISKSGNTTETLVNAGVVLSALEEKYKKSIYKQTLFIGDAGTDFMKAGKRLGVKTYPMPSIIGGRYSVMTEVGMIPLAILGHDTDKLISGFLDATAEEFESEVAKSAVTINHYISKSYRHYNFFAFEPRLEKLGAWYRQLFAESLGKELDRDKKPVKKGMLPTISTPTELHSVGQLYLSGFSGVYTDFVTFDDDAVDYDVPKKGVSNKFGKFTAQEVATAIYGGVMSAYQEKQLPYRSTIMTDDLSYSLGLFTGMRMLEVMYIAELMNLNAFDQPNVELYKIKTKEILGL